MALLIKQDETVRVIFPRTGYYFTNNEIAEMLLDPDYESVVLNIGIVFYSKSGHKNALVSEFLNLHIFGDVLFVAFKDLSDEFDIEAEDGTESTVANIKAQTQQFDSQEVDFLFLEILRNFSAVLRTVSIKQTKNSEPIVSEKVKITVKKLSEVEGLADQFKIFEWLTQNKTKFLENNIIFADSKIELSTDSPESIISDLITKFLESEEYEKCATLQNLSNGTI